MRIELCENEQDRNHRQSELGRRMRCSSASMSAPRIASGGTPLPHKYSAAKKIVNRLDYFYNPAEGMRYETDHKTTTRERILRNHHRGGDKDWRHETDNDGWRNPVMPKEEKENRCDADVGRQLDRMDLVIQPFLSEIHFSIPPARGSNITALVTRPGFCNLAFGRSQTTQ